MANNQATSILEYLTAKNPDLEYEVKKNTTLTERQTWVKPSHVRPWAEFNFETMERVFDGKLMDECRRRDRAFSHLPPLHPDLDLVEGCEDSTTHILTLWTRQMVQIALLQVTDIFNPVFWVVPSRTKSLESSKVDVAPTAATDEKGRRKSSRPRPHQAAGKKPKSSTRWRPDGAGMSLAPSGLETDTAGMSLPPSGPEANSSSAGSRNRLPSEIKPGSIWTSAKLTEGRLTDAGGKLRSLRLGGKEMLPLIQIYHYCVQARARYGFLITSREIIVVRIKPMAVVPTPGSVSGGGELDNAALKRELQRNGLMEYKAIPWANHCSSSPADDHAALRSYRDLTMNLALWILCILAGNNSDPDWDYAPLAEEVLKPLVKAGVKEKTEQSEQATNDDDGSTSTQASQSPSKSSSFAFSNPSMSFSAAFSQEPFGEKLPPPSYTLSSGEKHDAALATPRYVPNPGGSSEAPGAIKTGAKKGTRKRARLGDDVAEEAGLSVAAADGGQLKRRRSRRNAVQDQGSG
ncbi:hypothetical protein B0T24DRAFT_694366 [Lasiosphaeria ovina]|uniref:Uncharacterized protein n=1 Tax=Lasiosphaeria ovina TaxID=92902 RepID=A0AAE0KMK6_9PEZI|nr:hypothetical protein B0T24DRAFT_694366 [Lasiosphaeria ovina]